MSTSPLSLLQIQAVATKYAPVVRFHPNEQYFMCSMEWFLLNSTLHGPNTKILGPTIAQLPVGSVDDGKYWLEMQSSAKPGNPFGAKAYVKARWTAGLSYTDIQYWFFSGYNGPGTAHVSNLVSSSDVGLAPLGEHWADWEQVTIRVDNGTQAVLGVYISQHGKGEWITDLSRFQRKGDQFIVYASRNGHANYSAPGTNPTNSYDYKVVGFYLRNDTADGGQSFDCAGHLEVVAADFVAGFTQARWLSFPYRWGKGTDSSLSFSQVVQILQVALAPLTWLGVLLNGFVQFIAGIIVSNIRLDDTMGVYGPQTQSYWNGSLIPSAQFDNGYTGLNTNRGRPPSVVSFNGAFHAFFQDSNGNNGIMHTTSPDGKAWSKPGYIGYNTSSGPCAVAFRNQLHIFYRDPSGKGILHVSSADGSGFGNSEYIGLNCDYEPTAAALNDNVLCLLAIDHNGKGIMRAVWAGGGWTHGYTGINTNPPNPPSVVTFNGAFHAFFQDGNGNNGIMHMTSPDGNAWTSPMYTGYNTSAGPCAAVLQKGLNVFYRDPDGKGILHVDSADGKTFSKYDYIGLNCDYQPHATSLDDRLLVVVAIDHGGNGIMRSVMHYW